MTYAKTSISVTYKCVDGWHIFASDALPELYVASQDAEKAYNDVGPSIELLLRLNDGLVCTVEPELEFDEFVEVVKNDGKRAIALADKRFAVCAALA